MKTQTAPRPSAAAEDPSAPPTTQRGRHSARFVGLAVTLVLVAGWALFLRPVGLGGKTDFIIVSGVSM